MRFAVALASLLCLAGAARAQGVGHALCEEGRPVEDEGAEPAPRAAPPAAILPCAMVDSGALDGAGCADAPFYVVTHAGVPLCQVDVELFAIGGPPQLEHAPSAVAPPPMVAHSAAPGDPLDALRAPWPSELRRVTAWTTWGGPRDGTTWRPPRPS